MQKKLVIAEKPSVGKSIARVLGCNEQKNGYMEGNGYVVSWCFGHLVSNATPEDYSADLKKWSVETLPIIPEKWKFKVVPEAAEQFGILKKLMEREDVSGLVEATDAGREGELIFRLVYHVAHCRKPFERLWISSLEESAIRDGMNSLRPSSDYDNLYHAAMCRQSADWLYGINGTRLFTLTTDISDGVVSVGRVQTPTLKMIVDRQAEIDNFVVTPRWVVRKNFGPYNLDTDYFLNEADARECLAVTKGKPTVVTDVETQKKKQSPPLLFSLTTLSQEANKRFGYTAQKTLDIMQKLYEQKILTYPRTDSNYITSDMADTFLRTVRNTAKNMYSELPRYDVKRNVNNDKVSDHHAVILTESFARNCDSSKLSDTDFNIVCLVASRMIAACSPWMEWEETKVTAESAGVVFSGTGRRVLVEGWRKVITDMLGSKKGENNEFPPELGKGYSCAETGADIVSRDTKPPKPFTEDTLLGAMDKAGAKEMNDEVERKGLGTSATRAGIIEILIKRGYVNRVKKNLVPTDMGKRLIATVPDRIKNVDTTVDWENRLLDIEKGRGGTSMEFLDSIKGEVRELCRDAKPAVKAPAGPIGACPVCGEPVTMKGRVAVCGGCEAKLYNAPKLLGGHVLDAKKITALLKGDRIIESVYSRSKKKWYRARISIDGESLMPGAFINLKADFDVPNKSFGSSSGTGGKPRTARKH